MRRLMTCVLAVALAAGLLSGCTAGPNQDAVAAASTYSKKLSVWSEELSAAAEKARTGTATEWRAGEGKLGFEEVGLGEVLGIAPKLGKFEASEVENTPTYRTAVRVAEQVEAITEELAEMEPTALTALRQASDDSYWVIADLFYNTLGAAGDRIAVNTEAYDYLSDLPKVFEMQRGAGLAFAEQRLGFLGVAVEAMGGTVEGEERTMIPDSVLGVSIGAFIVDWLHEEVAFQEDAIEEIGSWKTIGASYWAFWGYGNINGAFNAPAQNAAALRPAFVAQAVELAAVLAETTAASSAPSASGELPALGEPYRQVLLDGYLPWGDPAESQGYTADRLWMLWRIRSLEDTADAAYAAARAALLEEFNRVLEDGQGPDFRPGSARLLDFIGAYSDKLLPGFEAAANRSILVALQELQGYGEVLRRYPMTAKVAADFDTVLGLTADLNENFAAAIEDNPEKFDQINALTDLVDEYLQNVEDATAGSLGALDDDAQAEHLVAASLESTAPGAGSGTPSPSPSAD